MPTALDASTRRDLANRLSRLTPEHSAMWGKMSAAQMIAHLIQSMKMALGELPVKSKNLPLRYPPLRQFAIYWMPFPKNLPTAPELIARTPHDWSADVQELGATLERFGARQASGPWAAHPAFDRLSGKEWGVLVYRHMDHHFRQFGV